MQSLEKRAAAAMHARLIGLLARFISGRKLRQCLAHLPSDELDSALAALGKNRADLFTGFKGNPTHRRRMAFMLHHFRVDADFATHSHWDALRRADLTCMRCATVGRCRSWMSWGARNDAPRVFCPNAALFDDLAGRGRALERAGH